MPTSSHQDLSSKVLERIARITLRPRWQFMAKNALFWLLWVISTTIAAIVVSAIVFSWVNAGWEFREITHTGLLPFVFEMLPVIWLMALGMLLFVAHENMRHTAMGYRYPFMMVMGLSLLTSVLLGTSLFLTGFGGRAEEEFGRRIPMHRSVLMRQQRTWANPSRGLLAGEVISVNTAHNTFVLRTAEAVEWQVMTSELSSSSRDMLEQTRMVRVIGLPIATVATTTSFQACLIFPWHVSHGPAQLLGWKSPAPSPMPRMDALRHSVWSDAIVNSQESCEQMRTQIPLRMRQAREPF